MNFEKAKTFEELPNEKSKMLIQYLDETIEGLKERLGKNLKNKLLAGVLISSISLGAGCDRFKETIYNIKEGKNTQEHLYSPESSMEEMYKTYLKKHPELVEETNSFNNFKYNFYQWNSWWDNNMAPKYKSYGPKFELNLHDYKAYAWINFQKNSNLISNKLAIGTTE